MSNYFKNKQLQVNLFPCTSKTCWTPAVDKQHVSLQWSVADLE